MKKFIYIIILTLSAFALVGCAADAPQAELDERSEYASYTNGEQQTDALELLEENNAEQDVTAYEVSGYSINPRLFEVLGQNADEVAGILGEYTESMGWGGLLHRFGDTWVSGFDASLSGTAYALLFIRLPNLIDGLAETVDINKLDKLFGGRIGYYTVTYNCHFLLQYYLAGTLLLTYSHENREVRIQLQPDMSLDTAFADIRDRIPTVSMGLPCMDCQEAAQEI